MANGMMNPPRGAASFGAGFAASMSEGLLRGLQMREEKRRWEKEYGLKERELGVREQEQQSVAAYREQQRRALEYQNAINEKIAENAQLIADADMRKRGLENQLLAAEKRIKEAQAVNDESALKDLQREVTMLRREAALARQEGNMYKLNNEMMLELQRMYELLNSITPMTGQQTIPKGYDGYVPGTEGTVPQGGAGGGGPGTTPSAGIPMHTPGAPIPGPIMEGPEAMIPRGPSAGMQMPPPLGITGPQFYAGAGGGAPTAKEEAKKTPTERYEERRQGLMKLIEGEAKARGLDVTERTPQQQIDRDWASGAKARLAERLFGVKTGEEATPLEQMRQAMKDFTALSKNIQTFLLDNEAYQEGRGIYKKAQFLANEIAANIQEDYSNYEAQGYVVGPQLFEQMVYRAFNEQIATETAQVLISQRSSVQSVLHDRTEGNIGKPTFTPEEVDEAWKNTFNERLIGWHTRPAWNLDDLISFAFERGHADWAFPLTKDALKGRDHKIVQFAQHLVHGPEWQEVVTTPTEFGQVAAESPTAQEFVELGRGFGEFPRAIGQITKKAAWDMPKSAIMGWMKIDKLKADDKADMEKFKAGKMSAEELSRRRGIRTRQAALAASDWMAHFPYYRREGEVSGAERFWQQKIGGAIGRGAAAAGRGAAAAGRIIAAEGPIETTQVGFSEAMRLLNLRREEDRRKKEKKKGREAKAAVK